MKRGAIFFTGKFGSTRQYAQWLHEATGLPVFDINADQPDPDDFDFLVLGSSIIVMKPTISAWLTNNWVKMKDKPTLLFTVSGTEPGNPNLQKWLRNNLAADIIEQVKYVPLRGRLDVPALPWLVRMSLKLGALLTNDPKEKQRMREGFDFMDKNSIAPIVRWVAEVQDAAYTAKAKALETSEAD